MSDDDPCPVVDLESEDYLQSVGLLPSPPTEDGYAVNAVAARRPGESHPLLGYYENALNGLARQVMDLREHVDEIQIRRWAAEDRCAALAGALRWLRKVHHLDDLLALRVIAHVLGGDD